MTSNALLTAVAVGLPVHSVTADGDVICTIVGVAQVAGELALAFNSGGDTVEVTTVGGKLTPGQQTVAC